MIDKNIASIYNNNFININKYSPNKKGINKNYYNNYLNSSSGYLTSNIINLEINKNLNFGRRYEKKITFRQKSSLNKNIFINTTNYL